MFTSIKRTAKFLLFPAPAAPAPRDRRSVPSEPPPPLATAAWSAALNSVYPCG